MSVASRLQETGQRVRCATWCPCRRTGRSRADPGCALLQRAYSLPERRQPDSFPTATLILNPPFTATHPRHLSLPQRHIYYSCTSRWLVSTLCRFRSGDTAYMAHSYLGLLLLSSYSARQRRDGLSTRSGSSRLGRGWGRFRFINGQYKRPCPFGAPAGTALETVLILTQQPRLFALNQFGSEGQPRNPLEEAERCVTRVESFFREMTGEHTSRDLDLASFLWRPVSSQGYIDA